MITIAASSGTNVAPLLVSALVIGLLFFFMIVRPQKRNLQKHRELVAGLAPGDDIITTGGIYGQIVSIDGDSAMIAIAKDTTIRVAIRAIGMKKAVVEADGEINESTKDQE